MAKSDKEALAELDAEIKALYPKRKRLDNALYRTYVSQGYTQTNEKLHEERWEVNRQIEKLRRKKRRILTKAAAQSDPEFITWKPYGFRHIFSHWEEEGSSTGYAICGNDFWVWKNHIPGEIPEEMRGTKRPLCGLCRKKWKRLTGDELP